MTQIIDGLGQIGSVIYASIADLPAAHLGHFCFVDDGTTGTLYVGVSLSGVATWLPLYSVPPGSFIKTHPDGDENVITAGATPGIGLTINDELGLIINATDEFAAILSQTSATPVNPVMTVQRTHGTPSEPIAEVSPDDTHTYAWLNGYGELSVVSYSPDLPAANTNHLGAIARLVAGGSGTDTFWYCGLVGSTPTWLSLQGPAGSPGTSPVFSTTATATELLPTYEPTVEITGAGTSESPYEFNFGIPSGVPGSSMISFPPLPAIGNPATTFWLEMPSPGVILPWKIPNGYSIRIIDGWGLYEGNNPGDSTFFTDFAGNSNLADMITGQPTALDTRFPIGQVIAEFFDHTGGEYLLDGTHVYNNPLVLLTMPADLYCEIFPNLEIPTNFGSLWLRVIVTPGEPAGTVTFDFITGDGGWIDGQWSGQTAGRWQDGNGWGVTGGDDRGLCDATIQFLHGVTITRIRADGYLQTGFNLGDSRNSVRLGTTKNGTDIAQIACNPTAVSQAWTFDTGSISHNVAAGDWIQFWLYIGDTTTDGMFLQHCTIDYLGSNAPFS